MTTEAPPLTDDQKEKRRAAVQRFRERLKSAGLTARGTPRKRPWTRWPVSTPEERLLYKRDLSRTRMRRLRGKI